MNSGSSIVILGGPGASTRMVYHSLAKHFSVEKVIVEEKVPRKQFLKRRVKSLGYVKVFGQILFQMGMVLFLSKRSEKRLSEIMEQNFLSDDPIESSRVINVASVNSLETIQVLQELKPRVVVVNGTRIISKTVLECIQAKFINMHAGITPLYRGVHGAYWALVKGDRSNCGVTVHLVDSGIDTGNILHQAVIEPIPEDNFVTYPLLQLAAGIPLLVSAVGEALNGKADLLPNPAGESRLWSHPTLAGYIWNRVRYGIK